MGVVPEQYGAAVVEVARTVVGGIVVLKVVRVAELGLEDVENVLWGLVDVALEALVPPAPEVALGEVEVVGLEVVLEVLVPGEPEVAAPEVLGAAGEVVMLLRDDPDIGSVEDVGLDVDVPTAEEGEADELGRGAFVVVLGTPPVEMELGIVVGDGVCWVETEELADWVVKRLLAEGLGLV